MDVTSIAALSTSETQKNESVAINTLMTKKTIDIQKAAIGGLIAGIQPPPTTSSIGHNIDTKA